MAGKSIGVISFTGAIFPVFLILKLANAVDWSWWWVTAPLWLPLVGTGMIVGVVGIVCLVLAAVGWLLDRRQC